jgi:hypothetical protein
MSRRDLTITKLERDDKGFWKCNITADGVTVQAHCKFGSWLIDGEDGLMKEVMPDIAAKIQEKVRPIEKKERIVKERLLTHKK